MNEELTTIETELEVVEPTALEAIERANIDIQISTARKFPRKLALVKQRMMNLATLDEETAASCFYKLNRQGKAIEGPSIRLAEIAASSFGNLRYGARVVANNGKMIVAQGFCHDLETNVLSTIEVQRRITNKEGRTYSDDMQVVTGNAACAIAARNSIFKVVPFAFVKPIYLAAKQAAVGDLTTLAERRTKMIEKFASLGVNQKRICESLGKGGLEEIGLGELETLIGLYGAIRDGDQTIDEAFPAPQRSDVQFGEAFPEGKAPTEGTIDKPKRHRRTKAQIEAERNSTKSGSGEESSEAGGRTASETTPATMPERATPLQQLRNMIAASPLPEPKEDTFRKFLVGKMAIEPSDTLDRLPDDKLNVLIGGFMAFAGEIVDGKEEEVPFA